MENLKLSIENGVKELTLRQGQAPKVLDPKEPGIIDITGVITSPLDWLEKRYYKDGFTIDGEGVENCHVIVDKDNLSITLKINEKDYYHSTITGKLSMHPKFEEFGINTKKTFEPEKLGQFMKMNRAFFMSREENMKIVTALKNLEVRTNQELNKQKDDRGSFNVSFKQQIIESNLPDRFALQIPVFKGIPPQMIEIEIYAHIDGTDTFLSLVSPGANEVIESQRNMCIDDVVSKIKNLIPDLTIIEV